MRHYEPIVVVVDSDADQATVRAMQLDRMGCHVFRRSSGIDALECVAECRPELVLSELQLPDFEGPELLQSIHEASPSTRVLFVQNKGGEPRPSEATADQSEEQDLPLENWDEITLVVDELLKQ
jgi:two-component system response regulator GlrR